MRVVSRRWVWVESMGVIVRSYIDFLILLIPTPLVSALFCSSIPTFCSVKKFFFRTLVSALFCSSIPTFCSVKKIFFSFFVVIVIR